MAKLTGYEVGQRLVDSGVVPPGTRRLIIDIPADGMVTMYIEKFIDNDHYQIVQDIISGKTQIIEIKSIEASK